MQTKILVPLDGSARAEAILPAAATLAREIGSSLVLLRVAPEFAGAAAYLHAWAAELETRGLLVTTQVLGGAPAPAIIEYARHAPGIGLIAMATHGRRGLDRWVGGSVAEAVLQRAGRPLLLVRAGDRAPQDAPQLILHTILVPLDGSTFAAQALDEARHLARATAATLLLVSVMPAPEHLSLAEAGITPFWVMEARQEAARRMRQELGVTARRLLDEGLPVRVRLMHGDPAAEILHAATEEHTDLVLMATHGRNGLQRLWPGSVALQVVQAATRPVLLVPVAWRWDVPAETSTRIEARV
ncbi:MAG TPA: universal stress protein [Chloroflexia bacterium]|nr:universal stress protein [Chloroflexia bacterium]